MKPGLILLGVCLLLAGCGHSERDVIGGYHMLIEGQQPQPLALELKADGTYVQRLKVGDRELVRTGKWSLSPWREYLNKKKPDFFYASPSYLDGEFVYLENAMTLEKCPKCKGVIYDVVPLYVSSGMMNTSLLQDPQGTVAYDK